MGKTEQLQTNRVVATPSGNTSTLVEQPILFYIELFEESSAYYMAARLQKENWEVNLLPTETCWICLAHALITPDVQTIHELCDYLSDMSEFYGGSFKRWELETTS